MLIKNLLLKFNNEQAGKFIFLTENNLEIALPVDIFPSDFDRHQAIYLSIDLMPLLDLAENKKQLLNELLNPDDKQN